MSLSLFNDFVIKKQSEETDEGSNYVLGDLMALTGAFLYALSNILQEHFLKS